MIQQLLHLQPQRAANFFVLVQCQLSTCCFHKKRLTLVRATASSTWCARVNFARTCVRNPPLNASNHNGSTCATSTFAQPVSSPHPEISFVLMNTNHLKIPKEFSGQSRDVNGTRVRTCHAEYLCLIYSQSDRGVSPTHRHTFVPWAHKPHWLSTSSALAHVVFWRETTNSILTSVANVLACCVAVVHDWSPLPTSPYRHGWLCDCHKINVVWLHDYNESNSKDRWLAFVRLALFINTRALITVCVDMYSTQQWRVA